MENYITTKHTYEANSHLFIERWKDTNLLNSDKIETFIKMLPQNAKILDIGAGFGKDVSYFCDRGFDCIGIDFCEAFIEQSKEMYANVKVLKMNFLEMDFPENSFDALWSRGALFHITKEDFAAVVCKLYSILKPGGVFYIQLISGEHDGLLHSVGNVAGKAHYAYYLEEEIKAIMGKNGFAYIDKYPEDGWINHYYRLDK